ncbi:hypothetical protein ACRALDRAFT_212378 [Sodiomyces alcalophilus JCM 7366]|uniref:uncharacterized protein n=1 Tax=Sodiomyces alcalophilus JCM 7366 TaxID=591952 RepID=UPI0039B63934
MIPWVGVGGLRFAFWLLNGAGKQYAAFLCFDEPKASIPMEDECKVSMQEWMVSMHLRAFPCSILL